MDYKKKYEEALEIARSCLKDGIITSTAKNYIETIFPELKESEDKRIKNDCIKYLDYAYQHCTTDVYKKAIERCIAWLEKQSEKLQYWKPSEEQFDALDYAYNSCPDTERGNYYEGVLETLIDDLHKLLKNQGEQKPADKVEPKFKQGKWIVWKDKYYKVNYNGCGYELFDQNGLSTSWDYKTIEDNAHLWTLKDAKDGNVLAYDNDTIVIFKDLYNATTFHSYCHIEDGVFNISKEEMPDWWEGEGFKPATKEQRDLLFQKMKEEGYIFDFEKKELKKIKQNPAWSEKDGEKFRDVIRLIEQGAPVRSMRDHYINWLKSLKDRLKGE